MKFSENHKKNISISKLKENNPNYGKPAINRGVHPSEETIKKQSEARKKWHETHEPTCGMKGKHHKPESCKKISEIRKGLSLSEEWCNNISKSLTGENNGMYGKCGELHPNWKGGITPLYEQIRHCDKYNEWRYQIFNRDNFTCLDCGDKSRGNLNAHHIIPFYFIMKENNITSLNEALQCKNLWDLDSGITLCENCHDKYPKKIEYIYKYKQIKSKNLKNIMETFIYKNYSATKYYEKDTNIT